MEGVIAALQALYGTDNEARKAANDWLQDYQKQPEAWATSNTLLCSNGVAAEPKLFAAQTFRSKITYDLTDLPLEHQLGLRDTLKASLKQPNLSSVLARQLALSLADLLLQLPEWTNAIREMVEQYGSDANSVSALLEFLTVLPEEASQNARIEISNTVVSHENGSAVISLLPAYLAPQVPAKLRKQAFLCFAAWLRAGSIPVDLCVTSPLFNLAFESLASDDLYEEASIVLCDLIHETQELEENFSAVHQVVPRLVALRPQLVQHRDDVERMRALAKVFAEAGEVYTALIVKHPESFKPVVDALAECAANEELDVVRVTFSFWWKLSETLKGVAPTPALAPIIQTYATLVDSIIGHLRYPEDSQSMTPQERDDFREFRHNIGDTLKDCCSVLGAVACIQRANDLVQPALAAFDGQRGWQAIEAPLFAMRSMGSTIDVHENTVIPVVMHTIEKLPNHPRIRYAAILVIARYTAWIAEHPEHIPFQLSYISAGFSDADSDVWLASAQAMKFLCEDCCRHLVPYVPQLHAFIENVGPKLPPEDLSEVSTGIAYVIAAMNSEQAVQALPLFLMPFLEQLKAFVAAESQPTKPELQAVDDTLTRLARYLEICRVDNITLPPTCAQTCADVWPVFDTLFSRFGHLRGVSENGCAVLRRSIDFFGDLLVPIAPRIVQRLTACFDASGRSAYLWITGRLLTLAHRSHSPEMLEALRLAFEVQSGKVFQLLPTQPLNENEDVIDDYCHLLGSLFRFAPDVLILSPSLHGAVRVTVSALSLLNPPVVRIGQDVLLDLVGHETLSLSAQPTPQGAALRAMVTAEGQSMVHAMVNGIVTDWEDTAGAITLCRILAERFAGEFGAWVTDAVASLPPKTIAEADRTRFLNDVATAMSTRNLGEVRTAFNNLDRASRKAKQRAMMDRRRAQLEQL